MGSTSGALAPGSSVEERRLAPVGLGANLGATFEDAPYGQAAAGVVKLFLNEYQPFTAIEGDWRENQEKKTSSCG